VIRGCVGSSIGPPSLEVFGEEEKGNREKQNADGDRRTERPVVSRAEEALDDIGDHDARGPADEKRTEEVAEREDKREGRAGKQARE